MTYEKKQAFEADSEKIEALQQPGQFPELVATDESLVALYNEQHGSYGQSLTPLQAEDRAMDDETNWTTLRTFFRRAQRLVSERLTVIVSLVSTVLTDVFGHLHERLDGNDEYGIPAIPFGSTASPAVAETLGTLPAAVRLLRSRKITNGDDDTAIPDGCSLARILCDSSLAAEVTELIDDNSGWTLKAGIPSIYSALEKLTLGCSAVGTNVAFSTAKEYYFPNLLALDNRVSGWGSSTSMFTGSQTTKISMPSLTTLHCNNMNGSGFFVGITALCSIEMPKCEHVYSWHTNSYPITFKNCSGIYKLVYGTLTYAVNPICDGMTNLIHFEIGEGTAINLSLANWSPTMALRTDTDADDYVDLREDTTLSNNLAQFLTNFHDLIALRLTDNGAGKTLTLSQSVYDVIKDENHLFVFDEGTMTIYAYLTNIKHWYVTK